METKVLIIGTDINAYYMSRCYHEITGKKADIIIVSNSNDEIMPKVYKVLVNGKVKIELNYG